VSKKSRKIYEKPKNDAFDVKSNLKKLGSSIERSSYLGNGTTNDDYSHDDNGKQLVSSVQDFDVKSSFEVSQLKQYQQITTDISHLKDAVHTKIDQNLDDVKKDFEIKLKEKIDSLYFYGAVAVIIAFVSLIYTLSYQPMLNKVDEIKNDHITIKDSLKSIQFDLKHKKIK
jgi:hypothetical protein